MYRKIKKRKKMDFRAIPETQRHLAFSMAYSGEIISLQLCVTCRFVSILVLMSDFSLCLVLVVFKRLHVVWVAQHGGWGPTNTVLPPCAGLLWVSHSGCWAGSLISWEVPSRDTPGDLGQSSLARGFLCSCGRCGWQWPVKRAQGQSLLQVAPHCDPRTQEL